MLSDGRPDLSALIQVGMMSCEERREDRERTLAQFHALGLMPHVVTSPCRPATPRGTRAPARQLLISAYHDDPDRPLLFVEDDIDLNPPLLELAIQAAATEGGTITFLYLNDTAERLAAGVDVRTAAQIVQGIPPTPGIRALRPVAPYGSQAVVIPHEYLRGLHDALEVAEIEAPLAAFDTVLARWLRNDPDAPLSAVYLPHPVQHRNSQVAKRPGEPVVERRSMSYALGIAWCRDRLARVPALGGV